MRSLEESTLKPVPVLNSSLRKPASSPNFGIDPDHLYTRCETAEKLRCSVWSIDKWVQKKKLIKTKIGSKCLFLGANIIAMLHAGTAVEQ